MQIIPTSSDTNITFFRETPTAKAAHQLNNWVGARTHNNALTSQRKVSNSDLAQPPGTEGYEKVSSFTNRNGDTVEVWAGVGEKSSNVPLVVINGQVREVTKIITGELSEDGRQMLGFSFDEAGSERLIRVPFGIGPATQKEANTLNRLFGDYETRGALQDREFESRSSGENKIIILPKRAPAAEHEEGTFALRSHYTDGWISDGVVDVDAQVFEKIHVYIPTDDGNFKKTTISLVFNPDGPDGLVAEDGASILSRTKLRDGGEDVEVEAHGHVFTVRIPPKGPAKLLDKTENKLTWGIPHLYAIENDPSDDLGIQEISEVKIITNKYGTRFYDAIVIFDDGSQARIGIKVQDAKELTTSPFETVKLYAEKLGDLPPAARKAFLQIPYHRIASLGRSVAAVYTNPETGERYLTTISPELLGVKKGGRNVDDHSDFFQSVLLHELGHIVEMPPLARWGEAITADAASPSLYAQTSIHEDFAESFALWFMVRNDIIRLCRKFCGSVRTAS